MRRRGTPAAMRMAVATTVERCLSSGVRLRLCAGAGAGAGPSSSKEEGSLSGSEWGGGRWMGRILGDSCWWRKKCA